MTLIITYLTPYLRYTLRSDSSTVRKSGCGPRRPPGRPSDDALGR